MKKRLFVAMMVTVMAMSMVACSNEVTESTTNVEAGNVTVEATETPVFVEPSRDTMYEVLLGSDGSIIKVTEAPVEVVEATPEPTEAPVEVEEVVEPTEAPVEEVVATPEPVVEEVKATEAPAKAIEEMTLEELDKEQWRISEEMNNRLVEKYGGNLDDLEITVMEAEDVDEAEKLNNIYIKAVYEFMWAFEDTDVAIAKLQGIDYMEAGYFGLTDYGPEPVYVPYYDLDLQANYDMIRENAHAGDDDSIWYDFLLAAKAGFETVEEADYYLRHNPDILFADADKYMELKEEGVIDWRRNID